MTEPLFRNTPSAEAPGPEPSVESVDVVPESTFTPEVSGRSPAEDPALSELFASGSGADGAPLAKGPEMFQAAEFLSQLRAAQSATLQTFEREVLGGAGEWVDQHLPRVRGVIREDEAITLTDDLVVRCAETRSFWLGAEGRLRECSRCEAPFAPPRCLESDSGLSPGVIVRLKLASPDMSHPTVYRKLTPCPTYHEDRLNKRLRGAGVPNRLAVNRLQRIENPDVLTNATRAFERVVSSVRSRTEMTLLIQGKLAREYGAALLAECAALQSPTLMSVHVPSFVRTQRVAMATKSNSGFLPYTSVDVLLLDGIEVMQLESKHWLDEILWLQEGRRDQGLVTILTTTILKPTLKDTFPGALALFVEKKK